MIKYKLACQNCDFTFDSWFASSKEYEKLKNKNLLNCHNCNSNKVEKTLMAPKLINKSDIKIQERNNSKLSDSFVINTTPIDLEKDLTDKLHESNQKLQHSKNNINGYYEILKQLESKLDSSIGDYERLLFR